VHEKEGFSGVVILDTKKLEKERLFNG